MTQGSSGFCAKKSRVHFVHFVVRSANCDFRSMFSFLNSVRLLLVMLVQVVIYGGYVVHRCCE